MNERIRVNQWTPGEIQEKLAKVCAWIGIKKGRIPRYQTLFHKFTVENLRSRESIFAYNELINAIEIYELWKDEVDKFPTLIEYIGDTLNSGPLLADDENPKNSSNQSRNNAFTILLAGKLHNAGVSLKAIEGLQRTSSHNKNSPSRISQRPPDITIESEKSTFDIQCKRPHSQKSIKGNLKKAREQLRASEYHSNGGMFAIDISRLIRPHETILVTSSEEEASSFLDRQLDQIQKIVVPEFRDYVFGALLYGRIPVHIKIETSPILSMNEKSVTWIMPYTASNLLFLKNADSPHNPTFQVIWDQFSLNAA